MENIEDKAKDDANKKFTIDYSKIDELEVQNAKGEEAGDKDYKKNSRRPLKKKVCAFCAERAESIDYKDVAKLRKFVTEKGKILPRHQTYTCAKHQRELTKAIKRARCMGLLPFLGD